MAFKFKIKNFKKKSKSIARNSADYYFNKSIELFKKGKKKRALKALNKEIDNNPTNDLLYYIKIYFLYKLEKYHKAAETYDRLIELNPEEISLYCDKSSLFIDELKDYEEALKIIDKALSIAPKNKELLLNKIKTLEYMGKYNEIIAIIADFTSENPNNYHMYI